MKRDFIDKLIDWPFKGHPGANAVTHVVLYFAVIIVWAILA